MTSPITIALAAWLAGWTLWLVGEGLALLFFIPVWIAGWCSYTGYRLRTYARHELRRGR